MKKPTVRDPEVWTLLPESDPPGDALSSQPHAGYVHYQVEAWEVGRDPQVVHRNWLQSVAEPLSGRFATRREQVFFLTWLCGGTHHLQCCEFCACSSVVVVWVPQPSAFRVFQIKSSIVLVTALAPCGVLVCSVGDIRDLLPLAHKYSRLSPLLGAM